MNLGIIYEPSIKPLAQINVLFSWLVKYQDIKTQESWLCNCKSDTVKYLQKFFKFHFNNEVNRLPPNSVFSLVKALLNNNGQKESEKVTTEELFQVDTEFNGLLALS